MSAGRQLQGPLVESLEAKQERRGSTRPAREAMRLLRLNEQLVSVGIDDHDGIAIEQRTGRHLPLMGVVGRDEVRSIGVAGSHAFIFDARENPLGRGIDIGVVTHDSRHCLMIAGVSILAFLIADRVWRSRSQLELAVVEYVSWFNNERLHESLGDVSPAEFEDLYVRQGDQLISLKMKIGSN